MPRHSAAVAAAEGGVTSTAPLADGRRDPIDPPPDNSKPASIVMTEDVLGPLTAARRCCGPRSGRWAASTWWISAPDAVRAEEVRDRIAVLLRPVGQGAFQRQLAVRAAGCGPGPEHVTACQRSTGNPRASPLIGARMTDSGAFTGHTWPICTPLRCHPRRVADGSNGPQSPAARPRRRRLKALRRSGKRYPDHEFDAEFRTQSRPTYAGFASNFRIK